MKLFFQQPEATGQDERRSLSGSLEPQFDGPIGHRRHWVSALRACTAWSAGSW